MLFLVELDAARSGLPTSPEAGEGFIERVIFPTLARAEALASERRIVAGGPVAGQVALRLMIDAGSAEEVDRIVTSLPLWARSETRITPLITFQQRRDHVRALLERHKGEG